MYHLELTPESYKFPQHIPNTGFFMYTKFQQDWMLGSALIFDHKFLTVNPDKKSN